MGIEDRHALGRMLASREANPVQLHVQNISTHPKPWLLHSNHGGAIAGFLGIELKIVQGRCALSLDAKKSPENYP